MRRATQRHWPDSTHRRISIHALLAESDSAFDILTVSALLISIHALLAESDVIREPAASGDDKISIHALLAESDKPATVRNNKNNVFLSTLSLRRATTAHFMPKIGTLHFYPRSPCGERLLDAVQVVVVVVFLSTLSLRRATDFRKLLYPGSTNFYPRSPCGERHDSRGTYS